MFDATQQCSNPHCPYLRRLQDLEAMLTALQHSTKMALDRIQAERRHHDQGMRERTRGEHHP